MKHLLLAALVSLVGCVSATMVSSPGSTGSKYGPTNASTRPGMIKYLNQGADSVIETRREDAYKQMYSACNSSYKIISEGPSSEGGTIIPIGSAAVFASSEYWYINFECN